MISKEKLIKLGFIEKDHNNQKYYEKNSFILKPILGKWFICANHSGRILSDLTWIEKVDELKRVYYESTNERLQDNYG